MERACALEGGDTERKNWFVVLLTVNTVGILEIAYLLTRKKLKPHKRLSKLLKRRH